MPSDMLPYFRFYPAETLSDERFQSWTHEERGVWFTLLLMSWREGSIPADLPSLSKLLGIHGNRMPRIWRAIGDRFVPHPDNENRLCSRRQEQEREKAQAAIAKRVSAGKKGAEGRWGKNGNANATAMRFDGPQPTDQPGKINHSQPACRSGDGTDHGTAAGRQEPGQEAQTGATELLRVTLQQKLGRHLGGCGKRAETAQALTKQIDRLGFEAAVQASLEAADLLDRRGDPLRSLAGLPGFLETVGTR